MQAFCTVGGYSAIKKEIANQNNKTVLNNQKQSFKNGKLRQPQKRHSIATKCLTTFVGISLALYCPLALAYWVFSIQICLGVVEPLTVLFIVVVANSSGWANAMGYFYNRNLKARRTEKKFESVPTESTLSASAP